MFSFCSLFLEGHKDSVTCAGFSHDSTLVATGDMSGLLKVWQVDTKEEVWSFEAGDLEVRSSKWDSALGGLG